MSKIKTTVYILMYVSEAFLPIIELTGNRIDTNYIAYSSVCAVIALAAAVLRPDSNQKKGKIKSVFDLLLIPVSFLNFVFCIFAFDSVLTTMIMLICFGSCLTVSLSNNNYRAVKYISAILTILLLLPVFLFLPFKFFGKVTTVLSVDSPSGKYYAEVIDDDQGALGGHSIVNVIERKISSPLITISSKKQEVYYGSWGLFKDIDIYWKGDSCLVINSTEYEIE